MTKSKFSPCYFLLLISSVLLLSAFALKPMETPYATINGSIGGTMKASDFITATELTINNSTTSKCKIHSYSLYYSSSDKSDITEYQLQGAVFSSNVVKAINQAKRGDLYLFTNVKVSCGESTEPFQISGLDFSIR